MKNLVLFSTGLFLFVGTNVVYADEGSSCADGVMVGSSSTITAHLGPGDADFFIIRASSEGTLNALSSGFGVSLNARLYDSFFNSVAADINGGGFLLSRSVSPGLYCLEVRGSTNTVEGDYQISFQGDFKEDDHGSVCGNGTEIAHSPIRGKISAYLDEDYFIINVPNPTTLTLTGTSDFDVSLNARLFDSLFNPVAGDINGGGFFINVNVNPGTYCLAVYGSSPTSPQGYTISIEGAFLPAAPVVLPGSPDMNGDGQGDLVIRRGNRYLIDTSGDGRGPEIRLTYGLPTDNVFTADMDGVNGDDLVIRRGNRYLVDTAHDGGRPELILVYGKPDDIVFVTKTLGSAADHLVIRRGSRYLIDTANNGGRAEKIISYGAADDDLINEFGKEIDTD